MSLDTEWQISDRYFYSLTWRTPRMILTPITYTLWISRYTTIEKLLNKTIFFYEKFLNHPQPANNNLLSNLLLQRAVVNNEYSSRLQFVFILICSRDSSLLVHVCLGTVKVDRLVQQWKAWIIQTTFIIAPNSMLCKVAKLSIAPGPSSNICISKSRHCLSGRGL